MEWMLMPLRRYAQFSGRSRRKEYWMYTLFIVLVSLIAGAIDGALGLAGEAGYGPLGGIFALATLVPSIAVGIRRLHDTDRSGWWLLIALVPLIGAFVLLYFFVSEGTSGPNRFGEDPKNPGQAQVFA